MIYPSIPGSTPLFVIWWGVFGSQYLTLPPRIYPSFSTNVYKMCNPPIIHPSLPEHTAPFQQLFATLRESTPPSQNVPPFLTNLYVRPSQNLPIPSRINPPFQPICMCDTLRKGDRSWERGVDSGSYRNLPGGIVQDIPRGGGGLDYVTPTIYPGTIWEGCIFSDFTPEVLVLHIPLILANVQIVMQILQRLMIMIGFEN